MSLYFLRIFRRYGNRPKVSIELDKNLSEAMDSAGYKYKKHAGVIKNKTTELPERIINRILTVTKDQPLKTLVSDGKKLNCYLLSRHLPCEEEELKLKLEDASLWIEKKYNLHSPNLSEEEREVLREKHKRKITKVLQERTYSWRAIDYNNYQSKVYLIGRSSADYAVLCRVFCEMKTRLPEFKPRTVFDFGSGVGTAIWAADTFWNDSLKEKFCVDSSAHMNDLACSLLKENDDTSPEAPQGVFYRQFLPSSHTLKYDVVVSAFALFEMPTLKARLQTILTLWKKTQHFLVIVEQGTNSGFQVINEARDFILELCNDSEESSDHAAHVFAPCPHDHSCPRFMEDRTPCNFQVTHINPFIGKSGVMKERFSYVILKKGPRPEGDPQWPRIVREVLPRSRHVVCRMCTSAGKLQEIVFTSSKYGKMIYKCARASHWGDLLPTTIVQSEQLAGDEGSKLASTNEES